MATLSLDAAAAAMREAMRDSTAQFAFVFASGHSDGDHRPACFDLSRSHQSQLSVCLAGS